MNYLFWNICKKDDDIKKYIIDIIIEENIDVAVFAECISIDLLKNICSILEKNLDKKFYINGISPSDKDRIKMISIYDTNKMLFIYSKKNYCIAKVEDEYFGSQLIAMVHFPSKLCGGCYEERNLLASEISKDIAELEDKYKLDNTILIGDFNCNPFESPIRSIAGFNAVSSAFVSRRKTKCSKGIKKKYFFNPMWSYMGEYSKSPGTYFYRSSGAENLYWNTLDQVLLRPSLIDYIAGDKAIRVVSEVNGSRLYDENGLPCISDHFPIICKLTLRKD